MAQPEKTLREKIDTQKGTTREFKPDVGLSPENQLEDSRTGKVTPERNMHPSPAPEESNRSQNAIGGTKNR